MKNNYYIKWKFVLNRFISYWVKCRSKSFYKLKNINVFIFYWGGKGSIIDLFVNLYIVIFVLVFVFFYFFTVVLCRLFEGNYV